MGLSNQPCKVLWPCGLPEQLASHVVCSSGILAQSGFVLTVFTSLLSIELTVNIVATPCVCHPVHQKIIVAPETQLVPFNLNGTVSFECEAEGDQLVWQVRSACTAVRCVSCPGSACKWAAKWCVCLHVLMYVHSSSTINEYRQTQDQGTYAVCTCLDMCSMCTCVRICSYAHTRSLFMVLTVYTLKEWIESHTICQHSRGKSLCFVCLYMYICLCVRLLQMYILACIDKSKITNRWHPPSPSYTLHHCWSCALQPLCLYYSFVRLMCMGESSLYSASTWEGVGLHAWRGDIGSRAIGNEVQQYYTYDLCL